LTVPCESATAATVGIRVAAPAGLELRGETTWRGRSRGVVRLSFTAHPAETGADTLHVRQTYADGTVVSWSPVVHVVAARNAARDRAVILFVAAAVVAAWLVLRRRRSKRA
jgi:hypothetical protein